MANQELLGKTYTIPDNIRNAVKMTLASTSDTNGAKRAKTIINNGTISYEAMMKWRHEMQTVDKVNDIKYRLGGGAEMEAFIENTLNQERAGVERSKEARRDVSANPNSELQAFQTPRLNEEKKELEKNAVAVIVNSDDKILLLKRGSGAPWMPNRWALVGGRIEKGEDAETACKREIEEETGLVIKKFVESFTIQRHEDSEETIFACRFIGEDTEIELDKSENTNYGWYDMTEMDYLEIVPHLIEYITLVFKKYD